MSTFDDDEARRAFEFDDRAKADYENHMRRSEHPRTDDLIYVRRELRDVYRVANPDARVDLPVEQRAAEVAQLREHLPEDIFNEEQLDVLAEVISEFRHQMRQEFAADMAALRSSIMKEFAVARGEIVDLPPWPRKSNARPDRLTENGIGLVVKSDKSDAAA